MPATDARICGYPPVVDDNCRTLILGSMPSAESLRRGFYYAHPRNAFWRILADAFCKAIPETVEEKKRLLLSHNLALWDVIGSCERKGSLDADIRGERVNDFDAFFAAYPKIRAVLINGGCAHALFLKRAGAAANGRAVYRLPSTSPAYVLAYEQKFALWQAALCQSAERNGEPI